MTLAKLFIYVVTRTDEPGLAQYTEFVVVARTAMDARTMRPDQDPATWPVTCDLVEAKVVGTAIRGIKAGTVLSSCYKPG